MDRYERRQEEEPREAPATPRALREGFNQGLFSAGSLHQKRHLYARGCDHDAGVGKAEGRYCDVKGLGELFGGDEEE